MGRIRAAGVPTGIGIQTDMSTPAFAKIWKAMKLLQRISLRPTIFPVNVGYIQSQVN
jgi:hypothetical protein